MLAERKHMGSYAQCWLDDLFVGSSKNDIDTNLISLFRPADKRILSSPIHNLPPHLEHYRESIEKDSDLRIVFYETSVDVVRDRLDVLGYDLSTAKQAFQEWINEERKRSIEMMEELQQRDSSHRDLMDAHYRSEVEILSELSPESWIQGLKTIRSSGLKTNYYGRYEGPYENTSIGYMLSHEWYGFPGWDFIVPLRLAIEACKSGKSLIYDVTDLIWSEYFDYQEDFVEYGLSVSASEYSSNAKTIVLTEGKNDAWVLKESMNILFPYLEDYFSFLDFEGTGFGGGVGNLANVVKVFAGAGIVNNVVALFDNDTAAAAACKSLDRINMPANIAVRRLPKLELLKSYPTVGPSGKVELDVNGIAASIELYFGEDVLKINGDKLTPIQWTGYDRALDRYQGEVLDKDQLQNRFRHKLRNQSGSPGQEWDGLRAVFQVIFQAFVEKNRRAICKRPTEYCER